MARDRFFQDYLSAYDTRYNSNVIFALDESVVTGFILEIPAARGVLSADEREAVRRLGVHMHEALLAHERVRRLAAKALAGHGLLNAFPYPMWLIDAERWVLFSNPAAQSEQIGDEARTAQRGARFLLTGDRADRALTQQLQALQQAKHSASAVIDVRRRASDPPAWLQLAWLLPGAALGVFGDRPLVLATLFDSSLVAPLDPFVLAQMFKLTPAEARVAVGLGEGLPAEEIAQRHGTRVTTVRTQIRQVLAKLGARRLNDAVRLLHQGEALWAQADRAA